MRSRAFTLIELLIVISIIAILGTMIVPSFSKFQSSSLLSETAAQIEQNLRLARDKALAGFNDVGSGIYFDITNNKYIIYSGNSYNSRLTAYDLEFSWDDSLEVSVSSPEIIFLKGSGYASSTSYIQLKHNGQIKTITVNSYGFVDVN